MRDEVYTDAIQIKAEDLRDTILRSEEYSRYISCKRELEKNQELYQRVNEFRRKNFELQMEIGNPTDEQINHVLDEYDDTLRESVVNAYMQAEVMLCRRLYAVNELLMADLDLDLEFL
jgi:cell fate (sporulation/competence/biofilm development) regulator YlbF (YheA/YmcA/DUF963 family)